MTTNPANPWWYLGESARERPSSHEGLLMGDVTQTKGRVLEGVVIDREAPVERCRSCGASVWWGHTQAGKLCPFDIVDGERTAVSHFSTCRDADMWRKR